MATVFSSLAEVENRLRLDMNNPTFVEDVTILSGWATPSLPVIPPPPYVPRSVISVPPIGKNAILLLVDLPEILAALENGVDFANRDIGWTSTSAIGMGLFEALRTKFETGPPVPSPSSASHIAGGIIPGNNGSHVYGPLASIIEPTNLALYNNTLFFTDAKDNRIRLVDVGTGKVDNVTLPIGGLSSTTIQSKFQVPGLEIRTYVRAGGWYDHLGDEKERFFTSDRYSDGSPIYNYKGSFNVDVTPYVSERGRDNVPANRTGISQLKGLGVSPNGMVYFSDFVDNHYEIASFNIVGTNTQYNVSDTTGFENGKIVTIYGFRASPSDPTYPLNYGFNGVGLIQSFVPNTSVTVNIASSGNPLSNRAFLILESRLRQIPRTAY